MSSVPCPVDPLQFAKLVNPSLTARSGKVFYSSPAAFSAPAKIYLLGLNPGGSPITHSEETIGTNLEAWRQRAEGWSEYTHEAWEGAEPGSHGMAPRITHLFSKLGLNFASIPASNVVFVRTCNEADLANDKAELLAKCWPVHRAVIATLGISTVLCLGGTAGRWVRSMLGANDRFDEFRECNGRGWTSEAHLSPSGMHVLTLTHPSRPNWINSEADPSPLVRRVLANQLG